MDEARRAKLSAWLPASISIQSMSLMSGGAIQQNWKLDVQTPTGPQGWVLRTDSAATLTHSRPRADEFALLQAAHKAGVAVPEPLMLCTDRTIIGAEFFIMRRVEGIAAAHRVVRSETLAGGRVPFTEKLAHELARIHAIKPQQRTLSFLHPHPPIPPLQRFVADMRAHLDTSGKPQPILEWGLRHLERQPTPSEDIVLCHNDFRTGNIMADDHRITGVLDWEFAAWGSRHEDLGWLCARCWRFGSQHEAGGIGPRETLYAAYEQASGHHVNDTTVRLWELAATIRWAVIALSQAERHLSGAEPSLELALTAHIVPELERDIMQATT